jgi:hypothetical protein
MKIKPALYTFLTLAVFVASFIIKIAGQPLIFFLIIGFAVLYLSTVIVTQLYDAFAGNSPGWLD